MSTCFCIGPVGNCPCMRSFKVCNEFSGPLVTSTDCGVGEGWQRCPDCDGSGFDRMKPSLVGCVPSPDCPSCNGRRIISILTGNPPA